MEDRFKEIALVVRYAPEGTPQLRETVIKAGDDGRINVVFGLYLPEDADFSIASHIVRHVRLETQDDGLELWTRDTCAEPECGGGMLVEEPDELKCAKCGKAVKAHTCDGCGFTTVEELGTRPNGKYHCGECTVFLRRREP